MAIKSESATDNYDYAMKYKVFMGVEYFREVTIIANSKEEAAELAEKRLRRHQGSMKLRGYSIGDVDIIETIEVTK
jgi:hypothetical protein